MLVLWIHIGLRRGTAILLDEKATLTVQIVMARSANWMAGAASESL